MNKLKTPLLASLCMLLFSVASHAETQWLDRIVAIVDEDIILASEVDERLTSVQQNIARSGQQGPPEDQLRREILDLLILENIQLQMADRVGLRPPSRLPGGARPPRLRASAYAQQSPMFSDAAWRPLPKRRHAAVAIDA